MSSGANSLSEESGCSVDDDPLGVTSGSREDKFGHRASSKGSVDSIPISDLSLSKDPSTNSPVSSSAGQDLGPDVSSIQLSGRRGSQVSTSSISHSSLHQQHRLSLSSFASSTGSPRPTASSNGTTIGDLSTASMPLLPGVRSNGRDNEQWLGSHRASDSLSLAASTSSRRINSSSASISDTSSVHSYPPVPRHNSNASNSDVLDAWKSWGASSKGARREFDGHSPVTRITATSNMLSPFAPLRKRLVRAVYSGKRVGVEVQLIIELVDALESYVRAFSNTINTTVPSSEERGELRKEAVNEVSSLLRELIEIAPEAQRCLAQGNYGPLASTSNSVSDPTSPNRRSSSQKSNNEMFDTGLATWWPRRLARDCRAMLEEVSLAAGETPRNPRSPAGGVVGTDDRNSIGEESGSVDAPNGTAGVVSSKSQLTVPDLLLGDALANSEWDPTRRRRTSIDEFVPSSASQDSGVDSRARSEELLVEGRRRWQAYVSRMEGQPEE
ncbi:hypothetical protein T439DRAFT_21784 [Meredithblackwellia eburnea MCA 4105]